MTGSEGRLPGEPAGEPAGRGRGGSNTPAGSGGRRSGGGSGLWLSVGWKILVAAGAAGVVATLLLGRGGSGEEPPLGVLFAGGAIVLVCTAGALALVVRWDLSLPTSVVAYAVGYNALIVAVKFVLAPYGLYEVNRTEALEWFLNVSDPEGVVAVAALMFLAYAAVYAVVWWYFRRRLRPRAATGALRRALRWSRRRAVLVIVVAALVFASGTGGAVAVLSVILGFAGAEYLGFVFASTVSVPVAVALGGATWLAARAFDAVADRAALVGDAAVLVSFFWVGLAFLAVYHVLWAVYVLLLITYWPLRAVVPK